MGLLAQKCYHLSHKYFNNSGVLTELEKPLTNQSKPDIQTLITIFEQEAEEKLLANSSGRKFLASDLWTQERSRKFVILGAPGSGKTTLMSYFAVMLADKQPQLLGLDSETDWLPILIRMRDIARYSDKSILEYVRIFTEKTMQVKTLPVGFFEHWLEQHQDSEYIGRYIDVLWSLVVDKPSPNDNHQ